MDGLRSALEKVKKLFSEPTVESDLDVQRAQEVAVLKKNEPGCNVSRQKYRARHVVLPSPEDSVSEVIEVLRELVSQLQAKIGQGPVQDVLCGPVVKTCWSGQGRGPVPDMPRLVPAWLEERHADLRDALTHGDNCRVFELTSKSERAEHMVEITGGMMS